jgi:hypothetical protein
MHQTPKFATLRFQLFQDRKDAATLERDDLMPRFEQQSLKRVARLFVKIGCRSGVARLIVAHLQQIDSSSARAVLLPTR